MVSCTTII